MARKVLMSFLLASFILITLNFCSKDSVKVIKSKNIEIYFDKKMRSKVLVKFNFGTINLTAFSNSEYVLIDSVKTNNFELIKSESEKISDEIGKGAQYTLIGKNATLEKQVRMTLYDDFPAMAVFKVQYKNISASPLTIDGWVNNNYTILPQEVVDSVAFWSYMGASYGWDNDWVQPLKIGFKRENYMGMNWVDYGGGTPVVDVWRKDGGLAVGHVEKTPKLVSLPVSVSDSGKAQIAVAENKTIHLKPGQSFSTRRTFMSVHRGDYFSTLTEYSRFMQRQGLTFKKAPQTAYEPIWCAWGYEQNFKVKDVLNTLPKVKQLGIDWVVLDFGWSTGLGDYKVSPKKFPDGEKGMKKFVDKIHSLGLKAKLWWAPLAVHPSAKLFKEHPEYLLLNKDGSKRSIEYWHSYMLCPAVKEVRDLSLKFAVKAMKEWGFDGFKVDGNYLNGLPRCYNPAHHHVYPEESVEQLPLFFKLLYDTVESLSAQCVEEICPCGQTYSIYNLPYMNQAVASDPVSSWQIRLKGKTLKALSTGKVVFYGDHVELSDNGSDFASTIGIGGVPGTKFVWPPGIHLNSESGDVSLTAERQKEWSKWFGLYKEKMLSKGKYRGDLYDIGFDWPEAHVVQKGDTLYYAFYADKFKGDIGLRGLKNKKYKLVDYYRGKELGTVSANDNRIPVHFNRFLLIEAIPENSIQEEK